SIQETCDHAGYRVVTSRLRLDDHDPDAPGRALPQGVRGVIGYRLRDEHVGRFVNLAHRMQLPYVLLNRAESDASIPCCATDHVTAGRLAAGHLVSLGHRRIGVAFNAASIWSNRQRLRGIRDVLHDHGLELPDSLVRTDL